ncbi:MAG: hypothetical protein AAF353_04455 [Pseudomonadota bacterium]
MTINLILDVARSFGLLLLMVAGTGSAGKLYASDMLFEHAGPLTSGEIQHFLSGMKESVPLDESTLTCLHREAETRAKTRGDPDTLDPYNVDLMPAGQWEQLDRAGKRIILTQVIINQALFECL